MDNDTKNPQPLEIKYLKIVEETNSSKLLAWAQKKTAVGAILKCITDSNQNEALTYLGKLIAEGEINTISISMMEGAVEKGMDQFIRECLKLGWTGKPKIITETGVQHINCDTCDGPCITGVGKPIPPQEISVPKETVSHIMNMDLKITDDLKVKDVSACQKLPIDDELFYYFFDRMRNMFTGDRPDLEQILKTEIESLETFNYLRHSNDFLHQKQLSKEDREMGALIPKYKDILREMSFMRARLFLLRKTTEDRKEKNENPVVGC